MGENGWLQKFLYLIMAVLGIYILYKGSTLLGQSQAVRDILEEGKIQRTLEDAALNTYTLGYTAAVRRMENENRTAGWMRQLVPVYSYLSENGGTMETGNDEESGSTETENDEESRSTETENDEESRSTETENEEESRSTETENDEESEFADFGKLPEETVAEAVTERVTEHETERKMENEMKGETENIREASGSSVSDELLSRLEDFDYLVKNYYTVDGGTTADGELLDGIRLLGEDLSIRKNADVPQILIYHTHSQEAFADSEEGRTEDTIVGMGEVLAEELRNRYGYSVIHDTGVYDLVNGILDRSAAYDYARASVEKILDENPTVEVIIDLHRDGVEGQKFVTWINGKPASMIMFFNGISRNNQDQPLYWLENPYIEQNLAFSLQLQVKAREQYPGFTRNIYLKAERFNLHLRPRSLLIEAGTQMNTVEEEKNAMIPLADLLNQVLDGS